MKPLLSILLISALATVAAQPASAAEIHSSAGHTLLSGTQIGTATFTFEGGTVSCKKQEWSGTINAKTVGTASLAPSFAECTMFGFISVPVHTNGCVIIVYTYSSGRDISCPSGKAMEYTTPNCTITVGTQTNLSSAAISTLGTSPKRFVRITFALLNIRFQQHGKGGTPCKSEELTNGQFQAETTVTGTAGGSQVDLWYA